MPLLCGRNHHPYGGHERRAGQRDGDGGDHREKQFRHHQGALPETERSFKHGAADRRAAGGDHARPADPEPGGADAFQRAGAERWAGLLLRDEPGVKKHQHRGPEEAAERQRLCVRRPRLRQVLLLQDGDGERVPLRQGRDYRHRPHERIF